MMEFIEITRENWESAISLHPKAEQYKFLPEHIVLHSLARSYVERNRPDRYVPYLILHDGKPVGSFLFRSYGIGCNLISFFIDHQYQGKGLGKLAVDTFIHWVKQSFPQMREIELCVVPENEIARGIYESFGFLYTGETSAKGSLYMELHFNE